MDKKKRLKKIESLKKQVEKHRQKIRDYDGKKKYLLEYWNKEIRGFEAEIHDEENKLDGES
ncbi:MAG TPA: hypothetical protein VJK07_02210 [Candidatus Nanoarchaeia archaeon]|nr:hypothetical protein [Candidatus Nanoarchaeia archaeon]